MTDRWIPAPEVADKYGVETATLGKWRRLGKGPKGWVYQSPTQVLYPESEVLAYDAVLRATPRPSRRPPSRAA